MRTQQFISAVQHTELLHQGQQLPRHQPAEPRPSRHSRSSSGGVTWVYLVSLQVPLPVTHTLKAQLALSPLPKSGRDPTLSGASGKELLRKTRCTEGAFSPFSASFGTGTASCVACIEPTSGTKAQRAALIASHRIVLSLLLPPGRGRSTHRWAGASSRAYGS